METIEILYYIYAVCGGGCILLCSGTPLYILLGVVLWRTLSWPKRYKGPKDGKLENGLGHDLWTEKERCGSKMRPAIGKYDGEVRELGRQTFSKRCHNCGQRMYILERFTVEPGGRRHNMVNFWICQECGEVERPDPPASAYGY